MHNGQLSILMSLTALYTINPKVDHASGLKSLVEMERHLKWHISSWY